MPYYSFLNLNEMDFDICLIMINDSILIIYIKKIVFENK